jgi:hypothetical protein
MLNCHSVELEEVDMVDFMDKVDSQVLVIPKAYAKPKLLIVTH